jgi:hypothetical protein
VADKKVTPKAPAKSGGSEKEAATRVTKRTLKRTRRVKRT